MAVAQFRCVLALASLLTDTSEPFVQLGGSFALFTVMVNVSDGETLTPPFAVPPSCCA
jgi:hypothetical protein